MRRDQRVEGYSTHAAAAEQAVKPARCPLPKVARRLGLAAFLFFLIKGIVVWVLLPLGLLAWHWFGGE